MGHYDDLETRKPEERERALFAMLPGLIEHAKTHTRYFARLLRDVDPASIRDRRTLSALPVTRKSDLIALQKQDPPFGGMTAVPLGALGRVFSSPGPIYDPQGRTGDFWRFGRALWAAGFRPGDLIHNTFSYHFTPAGFMIDLAAQAIGCAVFPAGVGQTEMQVQAIADLRPAGYAGTPSFLKIILEKADELQADVSSLKRALVSGEALLPAVREMLQARGIEVRQCYGTADVGLIAYETVPMNGLVLDEGVILEIVRPGSADPVAEGEVGEVVVTILAPEYPLIRFGTGDLSAFLPGTSACGRTNRRIKGWMGRADQATKVKGMFVHPTQVGQLVKRHPEIVKARLCVEHDTQRNDRMTLHCEVHETSGALTEAIALSLREITKLRGEVKLVAPGSLPNDGKVIDDLRKYD
ncbi:MAG TPA: AMP-binding protein [Burkholderiales bacterium]|jgi:phenylacetate-CoA ligase|nr:AMP-binding protein [Burkholderiales bacterium]